MKHDKNKFIKEAEETITQNNLSNWEIERICYLDSEISFLEEQLMPVNGMGIEETEEIKRYLKREIESLQEEKTGYNKKAHDSMEKKLALEWLAEELDNISEHYEFVFGMLKRATHNEHAT